MSVPVEVFIVPPAMTKFEIAEYLKRLYDLPVLKVHTANYLGKMKRDKNGRKFKLPDFKKAYVYLRGPDGGRPKDVRYQPILEQKTEEALAAGPRDLARAIGKSRSGSLIPPRRTRKGEGV